MPMLEIRNKLRRRGLSAGESRAFTTHARYYADLLTVADEIQCGDISRLGELYGGESLDIAALCEPVGSYSDPQGVLEAAYKLLKPGGLLLYKLSDGGSAEINYMAVKPI
jgi:SAM-dependent methyltransferase